MSRPIGSRWASEAVTTGIVLLTRDLRRIDNPALAAAARDLDEVLPLFVFDPRLLAGGHASANRLTFLLESLEDLDRGLGGGLVTRYGDPVETALRVAAEAGATVIDITGDVSGYARRREDRLLREAAGVGIEVRIHPGAAVVEAGGVRPGGPDHFKDHFAVFTPYHRRWLAAPWRPALPLPARLRLTRGIRSDPRPVRPPIVSPNLPRGGETAGRSRLDGWLADGVTHYAALADDLAADATSRLSPYLHLGCVSPLEVARRSLAAGGPGAEAFVRQLCWRDFHHQVLAARPDLPTADYRPRGDRWRNDPAAFDRWQEGRTGVPIVDAAMHQLKSEGWIANRARLVAASYLVKDLYIDWRLGAAHFQEWLVDGDLASNSGNWQWVAGTGNDSRPNRILNPARQALRFDPRGEYVRRHLPDRGSEHYPPPLVDHAAASARFRSARRSAGEPGAKEASERPPGRP